MELEIMIYLFEDKMKIQEEMIFSWLNLIFQVFF